MQKEILCTLGPASMSREVIGRLQELGASLFRINLSHTPLDKVRSAIGFIQDCTSVPVCLDTEGAQIRTGDFVDKSIRLRENSTVRLLRRAVPGDSANLNFNPLDIIKRLEAGDLISIDFNSVLVQVIRVEDAFAELRVITGGDIGRNKAVTVEREILMPPLTEKDKGALAIGREMGVGHFALSFANRAADVDEIRQQVGAAAVVISKIESKNGLLNLDEIARKSDALLIDRGDLSRQVPIEQIPQVQKMILQRGKELGVKVYVATNLLESMVTMPTPTRAEVNDIYNTLSDGAAGLVLAAETAVGAYPVRCASMIVKLIQQFEHSNGVGKSHRVDPASTLIAPHGGQLVCREATSSDLRDVAVLPALAVSQTDLMDCEQIALGTYSPLTGFMDREALSSVLDHNALPDGTVWTMPILLQVSSSEAGKLSRGDRVALRSQAGAVHALMDITDIYTVDILKIAKRWFGTDSRDHPGVARITRAGSTCIGGNVLLTQRLPSPHRHYELPPEHTRFIFTHKGWSKVVGFHGRNPAHRVHQFIQMEALRRAGADGLFISPVIGPKKANDFLPDIILRSYQLMLEFGLYPEGKVVLGSFSTYSRYCGPREAVFTALCRKNMGCSHFVIGRDHAGVGSFYPADAARRLFESLGDIGITPLYFGHVGYNPATQLYEESRDGVTLREISGSQIREALRARRRVPDWVMWTGVQDLLFEELAAGNGVFCD